MQNDLFSEQIIQLAMMAKDDTDAIRQTGKLLYEADYVNESHIENVVRRERNFPTGLQLEDTALAIPHATPEGNVRKSGIAVAKLITPVKFCSMEDPKKFVDAEFVFLLALKDSKRHLNILKELFASFQKPKIMRALRKSRNAKEILNILHENFDEKKPREEGIERSSL